MAGKAIQKDSREKKDSWGNFKTDGYKTGNELKAQYL